MVVALLLVTRKREDYAQCSEGFTLVRGRCLAEGCPPPLALREGVCDAPDVRVRVGETRLVLGPSDWEAEGKVTSRVVHVAPFEIDAFEATVNRFTGKISQDGARAASGMTRGEAAAYCASRGGRLPTEDEWIAAAAGESARRYPWGDTGAVCRRGAWGLEAGPCSRTGDGPDTVGAHAAGDTPSGIHDMAGNVAEWVAPEVSAPEPGVVRGGSWKTSLATELRTWFKREIAPRSRDSSVGVRCAFGS